MPISLHYKESGNGVALIILHGLLGALDNWITLTHQFSQHFKVYAVDIRNHGKSPHTNEHSYELMAEDIYYFMQEHQIASAHIIGHSMGGKTAIQFATQYPEKVKKMIVVDITPASYNGGHEKIFQALSAIDFTKLSNRNDADEQLKKTIPDFATRQFLLKNINRTEQGNFEWKFNLSVLEKNYHQINKAIAFPQKINTPTLFISGGKSDYIQAENIALIKENFTEVQFEEIPEAGHWVHAESPKKFFEIATSFILH